MAFLSRINQSQNINQETQANASADVSQRRIQPYQKRNTSVIVENDDEQKIEQVLGRARSTIVVDLISKGDELTSQDLDILAEVLQHVEEEQKQVVEEEKLDAFICSFSKCYISGCEVHTLLPNCIHYGNNTGAGYGRIKDMPPRMKKGYELYRKNPECSHIEVYERHICVVGVNGSTQVINE